jgi:hypothetical protein
MAYIRTYNLRFITDIVDTPRIYQNGLAMRKATGATGGKPIAI